MEPAPGTHAQTLGEPAAGPVPLVDPVRRAGQGCAPVPTASSASAPGMSRPRVKSRLPPPRRLRVQLRRNEFFMAALNTPRAIAVLSGVARDPDAGALHAETAAPVLPSG